MGKNSARNEERGVFKYFAPGKYPQKWLPGKEIDLGQCKAGWQL